MSVFATTWAKAKLVAGAIALAVQRTEGAAETKIRRIAHLRAAELQNPENAKGPVAMAGLAGWWIGGVGGSFVAGFVTSVGCACASRLVPEKEE